MDRGELVPDEVVVEMVKLRLAQGDVEHSGWLLDGYPRSASQAEAIEKEGIRPDVFLLVNVRTGGHPACEYNEGVHIHEPPPLMKVSDTFMILPPPPRFPMSCSLSGWLADAWTPSLGPSTI